MAMSEELQRRINSLTGDVPVIGTGQFTEKEGERLLENLNANSSTNEKMSGFLRKYAITPHLMDVNFFNEPSFDKWVQATRSANQAGSPIPYVTPVLSDSIDALKVGYDSFINELQNSQSTSNAMEATRYDTSIPEVVA